MSEDTDYNPQDFETQPEQDARLAAEAAARAAAPIRNPYTLFNPYGSHVYGRTTQDVQALRDQGFSDAELSVILGGESDPGAPPTRDQFTSKSAFNDAADHYETQKWAYEKSQEMLSGGPGYDFGLGQVAFNAPKGDFFGTIGNVLEGALTDPGLLLGGPAFASADIPGSLQNIAAASEYGSLNPYGGGAGALDVLAFGEQGANDPQVRGFGRAAGSAALAGLGGALAGGAGAGAGGELAAGTGGAFDMGGLAGGTAGAGGSTGFTTGLGGTYGFTGLGGAEALGGLADISEGYGLGGDVAGDVATETISDAAAGATAEGATEPLIPPWMGTAATGAGAADTAYDFLSDPDAIPTPQDITLDPETGQVVTPPTPGSGTGPGGWTGLPSIPGTGGTGGSGGFTIPGTDITIPNNVLGGLAQGIFGYMGADKVSDAYKAAASQNLALGAPYRDRLNASYGADFDLGAQPGYGDAFNKMADISARSYNAKMGNPAGSPAAQGGILSDVWNASYLPALSSYRGQLGQFGGMGLNTAGQAQLGGAGVAGGGMNAIGYGAGTILNPQPSAADIYKNSIYGM